MSFARSTMWTNPSSSMRATSPECSQPLEIVAAVREAIGPELALGVRLCGDELIEGGTTIDDAVAVARAVEAGGQVDYINTSIGVATATLYMIEASMQIPPGYAMFIPSAIRDVVAVPVVGVGRFKDPLQADRALSDGLCDLVGVVRGQIADPDFAIKARSGHATVILPSREFGPAVRPVPSRELRRRGAVMMAAATM